MQRILTFNSHTGYSYLLSKTELPFDICGKWDIDERPLPPNFTIITLNQALNNMQAGKYSLILTHKRNDLFLVLKHIKNKDKINLIYVIHGRYQRSGIRGGAFYRLAKFGYKQILKVLKYIYKINFVYITPCVKVSWGIEGFTIIPGIDTNDFNESNFSINRLLTVGNNLHRHYFNFNLLKKVSSRLPTSIIGYNPLLENSKKADNFSQLVEYYKTHKAFLYLANEPEEGFNLSLLEAMAAGLPVITMFHPTSPIIHKYNGLVAFNEKEYIEYCQMLLNDKEFAKLLGHNARETVKNYFPINEFVRKWKFMLGKGNDEF